MAKKGQKFKHYSKVLKLLVVQEYLSHKYSLQSLARKYNISSIETILHWAQDYCKDGELAFEEKRGRATKENSPFKGRPRIRFVSENEKEEYLKQKEEYYKKD